jgi:hypothetical protein
VLVPAWYADSVCHNEVGTDTFQESRDDVYRTCCTTLRKRNVRLSFLLILLCNVRAQIFPFLRPQPGEVIHANRTYQILWDVQDGDSVDITLLNYELLPLSGFGSPCGRADDCAILAFNATNSGAFWWHVPADAPSSQTYEL